MKIVPEHIASNPLDLSRWAIPILMASSLVGFSGCERATLPPAPTPATAPDSIEQNFVQQIAPKILARDLSQQPILDQCLEVREIAGKLIRRESMEKGSCLEKLYQMSSTLLSIKNQSAEFPEQALVSESYRSLREVIDTINKGAIFYKDRSGHYSAEDFNYHQALELQSNMDLMIATLANANQSL